MTSEKRGNSLSQMRAEFEAWAKGRALDLRMDKDAWQRDRYYHSHVDAMWAAWQAAHAAALPDAFLSDVMTAAGLLAHGKQDKGLSERLRIAAAAMLAARPAQAKCWCSTCRPVTPFNAEDNRMVLCPDCGNKRCPRAIDHRYQCSGSNEPGQVGEIAARPGVGE